MTTAPFTPLDLVTLDLLEAHGIARGRRTGIITLPQLKELAAAVDVELEIVDLGDVREYNLEAPPGKQWDSDFWTQVYEVYRDDDSKFRPDLNGLANDISIPISRGLDDCDPAERYPDADAAA